MTSQQNNTYDFIVIGSGFGGSVSALRLAEKGYSVMVLERGRHYRDQDFARTNWLIWKYLWLPALRWFGILQMSLLNGMMVLHGSGVGGGSLGYANVLMEPDDQLFNAPAWRDLADWKTILQPHFVTAKRMLGVTPNPRLWSADNILREVAAEHGRAHSLRPTDVGVYFGDAEQDTPDPYFGGNGPARRGCRHCGACMVGCRHNAKNTLVKNYLYLAQNLGVQVRADCEVTNIAPLTDGATDGARYEVICRDTTSLRNRGERLLRARNIIVSAGVLGTLKLLFTCRDVTHTLAGISTRLGHLVRTNSEALLGVTSRVRLHDFSQGLAITSVAHLDETTRVEPVRYPVGSSLMRFLSAPLLRTNTTAIRRILQSINHIIRHPRDYYHVFLGRTWAQRTTILLVMQTKDSFLRLKLVRNVSTLFRHKLSSEKTAAPEQAVEAQIDVAHSATRSFASKANAVPAGSIFENILSLPTTAHVLGGCPFGRTSEEGVVDLRGEVFGHPGIYVVDGSIVPANPGINPSLTITALAEYIMSQIPVKQ